MSTSHALIAVDLSFEPERVVDVGGAWAARFGKVADVAYVDPLESLAPLVRNPRIAQAISAEVHSLAEEERRLLVGLVARLPESVRGEPQRWHGKAADVVAEHSSSYGLVVLGTHSRRGLSYFTMGSIAERIVRASHAPVLIARNPPPENPRVLCAVDLRTTPNEVVDRAVDLVGALAGTIDLAYVDDLIALAPPFTFDIASVVYFEHVEARREASQLTLATLLQRIPTPLRGTAHAASGGPAQQLRVLGNAYDLVVVGTHGRTGVERLWFGSIAENVARTSNRSVLVMHLGAP